jgi:hypothetical protein
MNERAFTLKSILAGVLFSLLIVFFNEKNNSFGQENLIKSYFPSFGLLLVCLLSFPWNALMGRVSAKLRFSKRELVVVVGMIFVVSWIPNFMGVLVPQMTLPQYKGSTNPNWQDANILSYLPSELLPKGESEGLDDTVHIGLLQGLGPESSLSDVPFEAWIGPGLQWGLIMVLLIGALLSLTVIVHRQWSHHEQLRYPLASVASSLLEQDKEKGYGSLFANPLFWLGFAPVFGMLLLNYIGVWFPESLPKVPTEYSLKWDTLFPLINKSGSYAISWFNITFLIIGIAYFIPSDVSLSIGIAPVVTVILAAQFYLVTGSPVASGDLNIFRAGGYIGFLIILVYTGRTYYFPIFLKAFGLGPKIESEGGAVLAARTFLLAYFGLILFLWSLGLDIFIGFAYVSLLLTFFLVITRLVCESGMPTLVPGWFPSELLLKFLGPAAIGAGPLVFIHYLGSILASGNQAATMMPYLATTSKLAEDNDFKPNRFLTGLHLLVIAALVVGFGATIYHIYTSSGISAMWTKELDAAARQVFTLRDRGQLEATEALSGFSKLSMFVFDGKVTSFFMTGLIAVLVTYLIRFRSTKWPFHPILFVMMGSYSLSWTWSCFLFGWGIKSLVVKFGGGVSYQKYKPIFLGLIMGEVSIAALKVFVTVIYYLVMGSAPSLQM